MRIIDYEFSEKYWHFHKLTFRKINLIVGDSGSGKTRLLNTIFNLGRNVAQRRLGGASQWELTLQINNNQYRWHVATSLEEKLPVVTDEKIYLNEELILERSGTAFTLNGKTTIKLPKELLSVSILQEEDQIKPLFDGFSRILRRRFFADDLESNSAIYAINEALVKRIGESQDLFELYKADFPLSHRLYTLQSYFPDIYSRIIATFKESFEFVDDVQIIQSDKLDAIAIPFSGTPVFCIRERHVGKWIPLHELSSGMQKALLIITDLFALPKDVIYLIDEYENSLGVGPINILPTLVYSPEFERQVFVTSHHPYIITNFPVEDWYVGHRQGSEVSFAYGEELVKRYGLSKQDQYLQLLNDPLYSEGIE